MPGAITRHDGRLVTPAARRIARELRNAPASGVWRRADAGYSEALDCARTHGLRLPRIPR